MSEEKREEPGGVNVEGGGDVTVGGDVAGRDVVKTTATTTIVGFSPKDVQRLIITVGVIVFVTAGIFFSGGLAVGFVALRELNRTVNALIAVGLVEQQEGDRVQEGDDGAAGIGAGAEAGGRGLQQPGGIGDPQADQ